MKETSNGDLRAFDFPRAPIGRESAHPPEEKADGVTPSGGEMLTTTPLELTVLDG